MVMVFMGILKEVNEAKFYLKQLEDETKALIEMVKLGEPQKSGVYNKIKQTYDHLDNILKEAAKEETPAPGYAKIDLSTGIKKVK